MGGRSIGNYSLGGSGCRSTGGNPIITMKYTNNQIIKTNDWYYKPHTASGASWSRSQSGSVGRAVKRRT